MPTVIYTLIWLLASVGLFLFGLMIGRCARKLPVLDEVLPWTMHWLYTLPIDESQRVLNEQTPEKSSRKSD
jgi:hypothetical protein